MTMKYSFSYTRVCRIFSSYIGEHFSYLPNCRHNFNVVILVGARHETDARLVVKFKNGLGDYTSLVVS